MHPWSLLHSGALTDALHFFCAQIVAAPDMAASPAEPPRFERFLTQCMLFIHGVLKSAAYRGSSGSSFELNLAARSQVLCRLRRLRSSPSCMHRGAAKIACYSACVV